MQTYNKNGSSAAAAQPSIDIVSKFIKNRIQSLSLKRLVLKLKQTNLVILLLASNVIGVQFFLGFVMYW